MTELTTITIDPKHDIVLTVALENDPSMGDDDTPITGGTVTVRAGTPATVILLPQLNVTIRPAE